MLNRKNKSIYGFKHSSCDKGSEEKQDQLTEEPFQSIIEGERIIIYSNSDEPEFFLGYYRNVILFLILFN